jgi:hypothetical protein
VKHDADDPIARLLRSRVEPETPAGSCLDAETVAAWFDGTLTASEQRDAESHASTCARCQALLATMAQAEPVAPPPRKSLLLLRWFAPALVAAAAVLIWMNVAGRSARIPPAPAVPAPASTTAARQAAAPLAAHDQPRSSAAPAKPLEKRADRAAVDESINELKASARNTPATHAEASQPSEKKQEATAGAAQSAMADRRAQAKDKANDALQREEPLASARRSPIVRSADGTLWRIASDGTIGRSDDNGTTWREESLGASAPVLAGSSPSANVVWFAGAGGIVVMTADGHSWQRRSLPDRVDLTAIDAVDAQTATVTTSDGRHFVTHDGGLTWVPAAAQENPAAPF